MEFGDVFPDRPMQSGRLFVPQDIQLDGDSLTWPWVPPWVAQGDERRVTYRQAKPGMLADFIRLHGTDDETILAYARKWGVLGLCEHSLPCSHNQGTSGPSCLPMLVTPLPREGSAFRLMEPLEDWRMWSRKAQSLINVGARLNQGKLPREEDWQMFNVWPVEAACYLRRAEGEPFTETVTNARADLAKELDGWISIGQVRPRISWRKDKEGKARFSLDAVSSGPNLFGLLALNIAVAIAAGDGEKGLAVCSGCGHSYIPSRRPNPSRQNYCEACGRKAAQREASRRYRHTPKYRRGLRKLPAAHGATPGTQGVKPNAR